MSYLKKLIGAFLLVVIVNSCTVDIFYPVDEMDPVIVVTGSFTSEEKSHLIKLEWTNGVYDYNVYNPVKGATVSITSSSESFSLTELSPGMYYTDSMAKGVVGETYTLEISHDGNTYNSLPELLKDVSDMDCAIITEGDTASLFLRGNYLVLMTADEPAGQGDYYLWDFYVNDTLFTDTIGEKIYNSDELIDGSSFNNLPIFFFDTSDVNVYDDLALEMRSISEGYYDFLLALQLEGNRGSPFDGPAANVPTNMSPGALGYFVVSDVTRSDICKLVEPFDQVLECSIGCFETMCKSGIVDCETCSLIGLGGIHPDGC